MMTQVTFFSMGHHYQNFNVINNIPVQTLAVPTPFHHSLFQVLDKLFTARVFLVGIVQYNFWNYVCVFILCINLDVLQEHEGLAVTDVDEANKMVSQIRGHLVEFPEHFLENQELHKTIFPLPPSLFT